MEVITTSPGILEARRTPLQLILLHHPLDCPTCDQAGACSLQDLVYEYGFTDNPYRLEKSHRGITAAVKEKLLIGSMARRESRRCILSLSDHWIPPDVRPSVRPASNPKKALDDGRSCR